MGIDNAVLQMNYSVKIIRTNFTLSRGSKKKKITYSIDGLGSSLKYGWSNASSAVIRLTGSYSNIADKSAKPASEFDEHELL